MLAGAVRGFLTALEEHELIREQGGPPDTVESPEEVSVSDTPKRPFDPPVLNAHSDLEDLLLLDPIHAAQPELVQRVLAIARAGIPVLAIGALPTRAPGLADARTRDSALREGVSQLQAAVMRIPGEEGLAEALRELELEGPLVAASGKALRFSVEHRRTRDEHILLVFNESWSNTRQRLRLNVGGGDVAIWDPRTGAKRGVAVPREGARTFELALEPAQSIILTVGLSSVTRDFGIDEGDVFGAARFLRGDGRVNGRPTS